MEVNIRLAKESDFLAYLQLMQQTYQESFVNEELGLTQERFSKEIFHTPTSIKFFKNMIANTDTQRCWLAFIRDEMVGSITMMNKGNEYEMGGFYVATNYQGHGIGKRLWNIAQEYAKGKDITLSVYTHNTKAIEMYKKWGFSQDPTKEIVSAHWSGWPKELDIKILYMKKPAYKNRFKNFFRFQKMRSECTNIREQG